MNIQNIFINNFENTKEMVEKRCKVAKVQSGKGAKVQRKMRIPIIPN